jgi:hypothetical protein
MGDFVFVQGNVDISDYLVSNNVIYISSVGNVDDFALGYTIQDANGGCVSLLEEKEYDNVNYCVQNSQLVMESRSEITYPSYVWRNQIISDSYINGISFVQSSSYVIDNSVGSVVALGPIPRGAGCRASSSGPRMSILTGYSGQANQPLPGLVLYRVSREDHD